MPTVKHKVFAYITWGDRLLVFSHPYAPEAGNQVLAGTMEEGEEPEEAIMREAFEETGLNGLQLRAFLGAFLFGCIFVLQYLLQPIGVPPNLLAMMPYLATLAVLLAGGLRKDRRRLLAPAKLGEPYSKGER